MSLFQASFLGILQGITEFFPISSSGHLIILPSLLGWGPSPLVFDTTLHLGTASALLVVFWKDLLNILLKDRKLGMFIFVGILPAGIIGFLFNAWFEQTFRSITSVVLFLFLGSIIMLLAEFFKKQVYSDLSLFRSLLIGIFQTFALLPGVSRSGSTISAGMLVGLSREKAARFSFLLSIPIVLAAGIFEGASSLNQLSAVSLPTLFAGFLSSFIIGVICINFLLKFLKNHSLYVFVVYRVILALFLLFFV